MSFILLTNLLLSALVAGLGSIALIALILLAAPNRKYASLPPGPKPGLFGNKIPLPYAWRYFERLTHQYGPVCTVWLGRNPLVIVGTYEAAQEILEKQSNITSDRPTQTIMAGQIMSGDKRILLVGYGERWRRLRKALHQGLQPKAASSYEPLQEAAARTMLSNILQKPDDFQIHAKTYAASIIMTLAYGKTTPTTYTDEAVLAVNRAGHRLGGAMRPGAYLVESFPILRYFPGKWKTDGRRWHQEELALYTRQMQTVREGVKRGDQQDCFIQWLMENQKAYGLSDPETAYLAGSFFLAGSDTTASALSIAIMAATCFPETTKMIQKQIDKVVGRDRLPRFEDQPDLPLVAAFIKEVYRWRPVSSGGFSHRTTEDVHFRGYFIPKGCSIVGNHWSISRDPQVFPDPENFRIERWFENEDVASAQFRTDINHVQYGFGRRVCAGKNVADRSLYINCAMLLWAFDFNKKRDAHGNEINIDTLAFTDTANSHPLPYAASITPRFPEVRKIVEEMLI
ncbi:cytochrome P450 [Meredithblackwellia eburnea MCA 4105]